MEPLPERGREGGEVMKAGSRAYTSIYCAKHVWSQWKQTQVTQEHKVKTFKCVCASVLLLLSRLLCCHNSVLMQSASKNCTKKMHWNPEQPLTLPG